jgi:uncharacterized Fe-S cluster-containing MiaB family protein
VVRRLQGQGELHVGLSDEGLEPARAAHNCERCDPGVRRALGDWNRTQDPAPLLALACACQADWRTEIST